MRPGQQGGFEEAFERNSAVDSSSISLLMIEGKHLNTPTCKFSSMPLTILTWQYIAIPIGEKLQKAYLQVCRGLMITAVCLGFFGFIISLVGMKCTRIGGSERIKGRIALCAGVLFIFSGLSSIIAFSWYANRITAEFYDPMNIEQKYELGAALFIGWAGSSISILGGAIFCFSLSNGKDSPRRGDGHRTAVSLFSAQTRAQNVAEDTRSAQNTWIPPKHFDKNAYV
ncbi:claudin-10-like isoform X2 [Stegostoma tigrinum]|uniref:claudin-10-like isoform X2 n=1 Tax=Stegostoma tigrinum TaxID=3053191 RepID=UPI00286FED77|nr:claudin-10-like isoform X2 [Stegostoma tigrinum]XP_059502507.1 claudin-10-like isoform X2 [Stegostoma tigrinum]